MTVPGASGTRKRTLSTADMEQVCRSVSMISADAGGKGCCSVPQAASLEQFLFGGGSAAAAAFGTEQDTYVAGDFEVKIQQHLVCPVCNLRDAAVTCKATWHLHLLHPLYADSSQAGLAWEEDKQPFAWEDRAPADGGSTGSDDSDQEPVQQAVPSTSRRKPVWDDPDDAAAEINIAAQPRLRKLRKTELDSIVSGRHTRQTTLLGLLLHPWQLCLSTRAATDIAVCVPTQHHSITASLACCLVLTHTPFA